jgi:predicted flavoprotein YhiN
LGLLWSEEGQGRLYPQANKASSVLDVLRFALDERSVHVECGRSVTRLAYERGGWTVAFAQDAPLRCDAVVLACGGGFAENLLPPSCRTHPWESRLCALRTNREPLKGLDNVRVRDARLSLHPVAGRVRSGVPQPHSTSGQAASSAPNLADPKAVERGELQFREYGVSGIVAFNLSRFADPGHDALCIDFFPDLPEERLREEFATRLQRHPGRTLEQLAAGMLLPAVARALLRAAGVDFAQLASVFAGERSEAAAVLAQALKWLVLYVRGFESKNAQVHRGGVPAEDVDPTTMELRGHRGLHVAGEAVDVDGPCGGYNLHWAWTSGILAGAAAAGTVFAGKSLA